MKCIRPLLAVALTAVAGCQTPGDSIGDILARQKEAFRKLPEEQRAALVSEAPPPEVITTQLVLEPGMLELAEARTIALQGNPDIHAARARIESTLARIAEARSLYLPRIFATHTTTRTFDTPNLLSRFPIPYEADAGSGSLDDLRDLLEDPTPGGLLDLFRYRGGGNATLNFSDHNSFSDHSSALAGRWVLFDGFARDAQLLIAKYNYLASVMSLADSQRLLVEAVDTAYYQAQLGAQRLRIARADEQFSMKQLGDARRRYDADKITKADVLNFEVRVRAAQANVVLAEGLRDVARVALAELMGLPQAQLGEEVTLADLQEETPEEMAPPDAEEWIARALQARPDLSQVRHILRAREEGIRLAQSSFSPEVSMGGTWGFERLSNMAYSQDDRSSAAGVEMRWDLYTGGLRTAQLRRAKADWWEASALLARTELAVSAEVRRAVVNVVATQEEVRLQKVNLTSARENRRIVESQYGAGKASLVRLNEAQRDLIDTDAQLATARVRLRLAWTDLYAAAGTTPPAPPQQ